MLERQREKERGRDRELFAPRGARSDGNWCECRAFVNPSGRFLCPRKRMRLCALLVTSDHDHET